jgi:ABC-type amino acid transport substrate-binding protein
VDVARLVRFAIVTVVLTAATIGGLRTLFAGVLRQEFQGAGVVYGIQPLFAPVEARVLSEIPVAEEPDGSGSHLERIRRRGALRVCVLPNRLPYAYTTPLGQWTGFDIEMAHRLAHDLNLPIEFVPTVLESLPGVIARAGCDLAMSGTPVTPLRASTMLFSQPYLDETLAWIVKDHLRDRFSSWEAIRSLGPMRVGAPDLPYYLQEVRDRAPALQIEAVAIRDDIDQFAGFDAFVLPAERGSVYTLLQPQYTVVVPQPDVIKVPLAYPLAQVDNRWESFINTWIELKRRDGTIDRLYRHWILGQGAVETRPRWSILRDVLHWVE